VPPRTPNYRQARTDRARAKEQRKQERLSERERESLARKAARDPDADQPAGSSEAALGKSIPAADQ
jgi:hypothetical protein